MSDTKYIDRNMSGNMSTDLPDILCRNNPDLMHILFYYRHPANCLTTPYVKNIF